MVLKYLTIGILSFSLISCNENSDAEKNNESEVISDSLITESNTDSDDDQETSYRLPSPLQIAYVFKKSGSAFVPALINKKGNVNKYNTSNYKRASNFGVYSSDLAYCLFNKKYQESKEYLKACKDMGSFLGLNQAFESDNLAQRFDKNIDNEDSLIKIITNVQLKTDLLFEQNKQKHITVIAFAGAWAESAYIASEVYVKDKNKKVLISLMEQLLLLDPLVKALKYHQTSEPEIINLISSVEKINTNFKNITSVKTMLEKNEELDFSLITISDNEFKSIAEPIKALRTNIVE